MNTPVPSIKQTVSLLKDFKRWNLIVMLCILAAAFAFEMFGVFKRQYVTITEIICDLVPVWARAMIWGWLGYHFLIEHR